MKHTKKVRLNKHNPSFILDDKHGHTSIYLVKLVFINDLDVGSHPALRLEVIDQHHLSLFSQPISQSKNNGPGEKEMYINKQIAIRDHIMVRLVSEEEEDNFEVEMYYE